MSLRRLLAPALAVALGAPLVGCAPATAAAPARAPRGFVDVAEAAGRQPASERASKSAGRHEAEPDASATAPSPVETAAVEPPPF